MVVISGLNDRDPRLRSTAVTITRSAMPITSRSPIIWAVTRMRAAVANTVTTRYSASAGSAVLPHGPRLPLEVQPVDHAGLRTAATDAGWRGRNLPAGADVLMCGLSSLAVMEASISGS